MTTPLPPPPPPNKRKKFKLPGKRKKVLMDPGREECDETKGMKGKTDRFCEIIFSQD